MPFDETRTESDEKRLDSSPFQIGRNRRLEDSLQSLLLLFVHWPYDSKICYHAQELCDGFESGLLISSWRITQAWAMVCVNATELEQHKPQR